MSFKRRAVGGAIYSPPVIGPRSTRDTSSCPIIYEFMGLVYGNTQSESESALFAKCVQTHEEFVVAFKKLLVHTYKHTYLT